MFSATEEGLGQKIIDLDYNSPDYILLNKLRTNLYFFSGFKNFNLLVDLNGLLLNEDGELREYSDFKKQALNLNSKYNVSWLKTEYDTAVGSAQMAARWVEYEKKADTHLLRYDTAGDELVRKSHSKLDGIILPITDSFWDAYWPPWDWGCRCDATPVLKSTHTRSDISKLDLPPSKEFLGNAGKSGQVFTEKHPYFQGLTKADGTLVKKFVAAELKQLEPKPKKKAK